MESGWKRGVVRVHVVDIRDSLLTIDARGLNPAEDEKDILILDWNRARLKPVPLQSIQN